MHAFDARTPKATTQFIQYLFNLHLIHQHFAIMPSNQSVVKIPTVGTELLANILWVNFADC